MADDKEVLVSDAENENQEKSTREQLKKASISRAAESAKSVGEAAPQDVDLAKTNDGVDEKGGQLYEVQDRNDEDGRKSRPTGAARPAHEHSRKRSRDSTIEEEELNNGSRKSGERTRGDNDVEIMANGAPKPLPTERSRTPEQQGEKRGEAAVESMTSPKTKRSRLQSDSDDQPEKGEKVASAATSQSAAESKPASSVPAGSGFANTSASSPFASLAGAKPDTSDAPQTSSSAFASSGFGSLAGSTSSGFGALGKSSGGFGIGGSFASSTTTKLEAPKPEAPSAFGGALGQQSAFASSTSPKPASVFASSSSGFGTLGASTRAFSSSGFGSLGGSTGLTSFASGKPSTSLGGPSKPSRPFGASADDADDADNTGEEGEDDSGFKSPISQGESDKQDERFYLQDLETGEEDEQTDYSCRAKLYNFVVGAEGKKEWKERGLGVVRLNAKRAGEGSDYKPSARLLMRADGSHRVILNTPVKKELKFGAPAGGRPTGGYIYFMGAVDGAKGLEMLQLKVRQQFAMELYDKIVELQEEM